MNAKTIGIVGLVIVIVGFTFLTINYGKLGDLEKTEYYDSTIINNTFVTYPVQPSLLNYVSVYFETKDVYSVLNPINYTITAIPNKGEEDKIKTIFLLNTPINKKLSFQAGTDLSYLVDQSNKTGNLVELNKNVTDNTYSFTDTFDPQTEEQKTFIMLTKGRTSGVLLTIIETGITIHPYTAKLQADTNRAILKQVDETRITNGMIIGLTVVLIGMVPLGISLENWVNRSRNHKK